MAYTRQQALDALREHAERHGSPPTHNDWKAERRRPSTTVIARHFGSWTNALDAAGLQTRVGNRLPDELAQFDAATQAALDRVNLGYSLGHVGRELGMSGQALGRRIARYLDRHGLPPIEFERHNRSMVELESAQLADPLR